jgi:hypothetical protein
MMRFELRNEEEDLDESIESEEELQQTNPAVRRSKRVRKSIERYSLPYFHNAFLLTPTNDEPKLVREVVDSTERKLWKDAMVEEMESLHNN